MTRLTYLYKYRLKKKDLERAVKEVCERSGDPMDMEPKYIEIVRESILDFLKHYNVYYEDDPTYFFSKSAKKSYNDDIHHKTYEITITPRTDKRKRFVTQIGISYYNYHDFGLDYIIETLAMDSAYDIGLEDEKDEKESNETSDRLWNFLDDLEDKETFWSCVLGSGY